MAELARLHGSGELAQIEHLARTEAVPATFLAQIEAHMGKRSLIAPGPAFESDYRVTEGIARTTWLRRDFFEPDYGAHPWAMWQANNYVRLSGASGTVGWNVLRPQGEMR